MLGRRIQVAVAFRFTIPSLISVCRYVPSTESSATQITGTTTSSSTTMHIEWKNIVRVCVRWPENERVWYIKMIGMVASDFVSQVSQQQRGWLLGDEEDDVDLVMDVVLLPIQRLPSWIWNITSRILQRISPCWILSAWIIQWISRRFLSLSNRSFQHRQLKCCIITHRWWFTRRQYKVACVDTGWSGFVFKRASCRIHFGRPDVVVPRAQTTSLKGHRWPFLWWWWWYGYGGWWEKRVGVVRLFTGVVVNKPP